MKHPPKFLLGSLTQVGVRPSPTADPLVIETHEQPEIEVGMGLGMVRKGGD